jgi:uncharacterized protein YxjI
MKKIFSLAILAMALVFTGCDQNKPDQPDNYADYPQLIVGKWFNFTPTESVFMNFNPDNTFSVIGYDKDLGWLDVSGTYRIDGNILVHIYPEFQVSDIVEISSDEFIYKAGTNSMQPELGERVHYRVQEQFDIKGSYSYLNSAVNVKAAEGKTALQLPEGVTFLGQNAIPVDAMHGDRIIDVMKKFFADATFAADGKLNHTMDGEAKTKNYTLDGNNLTFNLYEGSDTYKVNATSFPDEDGDRLFIIIPKQAAWLGGLVDLVEKSQAGLKLTEAQIAELEKEFLATFETFTVVLSLSKK